MKNNVFMVMPFSNEIANNNYSLSIKPICTEFDLEIRRADEIFSTNPIYDDIVNEIQKASIVIVDITGRNPNVFYELGMAHILKQPRTIMLTQDKFNEMPFDVAHFRIIPYKDSIAGKVEFEKQLRSTFTKLLSDYREIFADEFNMLIDIFDSTNKNEMLHTLIGLYKYKGTLNKNSLFHEEGRYPRGQSTNTAESIEKGMKAFINLGYLTTENDIVSVSEKGKAFIELLKQKGYDCYQFNHQVFKKGYKPIIERLINKNRS